VYKIGVIGTGYVGLVTAVCLADLGNKVICIDNDRKKIAKLKKGISPIYEPGIGELLRKNIRDKRISFSYSIRETTQKSEIIFICVGTPTSARGDADLSAVAKVASEIAKAMKGYKVIVGKSTVPAHTGRRIRETVELFTKHKVPFDVVSNPEFLREGQAISDTLKPDRIVIGVESKRAERIMRELYMPIKAPILVTDIATAEIIKHASNSFLSTKISFINAVANICERTGADVELVAEGMGMDKRIGRSFLNAGVGFGGYCFPKDLDAFIHQADKEGYDFELLKAVKKINSDQKKLLFKKVEEALWTLKDKTIAVLGLSFKPNTDDIRNSISIELIHMLQREGARVRAYDPQAMRKARAEIEGVTFSKDLYSAIRGADCILLMTEWEVFREMDLGKAKKLMRQPIFIDGRNIFDTRLMHKMGFIYRCIGRPSYSKISS
jgi:UDPglucose 6-dehydrogenase